MKQATDQISFDFAPATPQKQSGAGGLLDLYASRTEADFAHMERRLAALPPDEPLSRGAALAALFLAVRAMERAETFIGPLKPDAAQ